MSLAAISVCALFITIIISCLTKLNVGVIAIAAAWLIGVYLGGFKIDQIAAGFPVQLFLTLVGMTLLFAQAQLNGTLDKLAHKAVRLCRGNSGLIPVMFFFVAAMLASFGPGNIAAAALMAPIAMAVGARAGVPAFLMAVMVGNGANAGSLSPFAPTGIIVSGLMAKIGLPGHEWQSYWTNFAAHAAVAFGGYLLLGGLRLFASHRHANPPPELALERLNRYNWITLATIAVLLMSVIFLQVNVGMGAFLAAGVLGLLCAADHAESIRKIPWSVIIMVSGVTVLIALLEKTQGLALFTDLLSRLASKQSVTAVVAFITGAVSVYSSTSGVVLPAFLPTVPGLSSRLGADPLSIALAMNVGSHLVDVSPLSTIGALCIAAAPAEVDIRRLFNSMIAWGFSMTAVGAACAICSFAVRQPDNIPLMTRRDLLSLAAGGALHVELASTASRTPVVNAAEHAWVVHDPAFSLKAAESTCTTNFPGYDYSAEYLLSEMKTYGVDHVVISHVCYYGRNNAYTSYCIKKYPGKFAGIRAFGRLPVALSCRF